MRILSHMVPSMRDVLKISRRFGTCEGNIKREIPVQRIKVENGLKNNIFLNPYFIHFSLMSQDKDKYKL